MDEYITIAEAARRLGNVSDKTIRRAIAAGKLSARYPHSNKAEISVEDLEAWHALRHVRPGEMQGKLEALEHEVAASTDRWQKTRAAMDTIGVLQENLRFEVMTQLGKLAAIIKEQDERLKKLTARIEKLEAAGARKQAQQPSSDLKLPEGHVWLSDFADLHFVSRNEAKRLYDVKAISGQPISRTPKGYKYIAIGPKGRRDFWVQLHTRPDFRSCDDCPHEANGQSV